MPPQYDILSKDILDNPDSSDSKKKGKGKHDNSIIIPPIVVHIIIVLFLVGIVFMLYTVFFSTSQTGSRTDIITFVGELESFNKTYEGNMTLNLASFTLETEVGTFYETSKRLNIENFDGNIYLKEKELIFEGTGNRILFDKNIINLRGSEFRIVSSRKTNVNLYFEETQLNFTKGRVRVNNDLNFEFREGTVNLKNFTSSFNFDGVFSISGTGSEFHLDAPRENLVISYNNQ